MRTDYDNPWGQPNQPQVQQGQGYQGPGSQYGTPRNNGWTWNPNAAESFSQNNQINPNTGMFYPGQEGGLVPWPLALQYQAQSDQGIWRSRQNMMRSGINYARGALGLLQSFRPGGGATIEAGQYNTLAGLEFNRAQMMQPLDLLGDFRREETAQARRDANRARERQLAVQIASTVAGLAFGGVGGAIAGAAGSAYSPGTGSEAGNYGQQSSYQTLDNNAGAIQQPVSNPVQGPPGPPSTFGPGLPQQQQMQPQGGAGGGQKSIQGGAPKQLQQQGGQVGQPQQGGMPGQQPQVGGAAGGMGMGAPVVGSNGDFSPLAYATAGIGTLGHPIQQLALTRSAAAMIDEDPFFATISRAVNARWAQRLSA